MYKGNHTISAYIIMSAAACKTALQGITVIVGSGRGGDRQPFNSLDHDQKAALKLSTQTTVHLHWLLHELESTAEFRTPSG
jgi:hypothetical protein